MHQSSKSRSGVSLPPKNAPLLGAIYPQKRCTFANVVGSYAINVPPTCLQSRPTHPVISAFYTILLRFSWNIVIFSLTTSLTAENGITDNCSAVFAFSIQKKYPKIPPETISHLQEMHRVFYRLLKQTSLHLRCAAGREVMTAFDL